MMTQKSDGGPAFPGGNLPEHPQTPNGMSLRDWFAGQALAGHLASCNPGSHQPWSMGHFAEQAYQFSDAMLAARDKD